MKEQVSVSASGGEDRLRKDWVLGSNPAIRRVARHAERAAEFECPVLISGETGTGKEVWAKLLHTTGQRSKGTFVPVNCAALTATLAESQLFGHEKGAFTGALGASLGEGSSADRERGGPRSGPQPD